MGIYNRLSRTDCIYEHCSRVGAREDHPPNKKNNKGTEINFHDLGHTFRTKFFPLRVDAIFNKPEVEITDGITDFNIFIS